MRKEYKVYFIRQEGKGNQPIKVGFSHDPDERIKSLQTGNPNRLYLGASIPCDSEDIARMLEKTLHWLLKKKYRKLHGEWFIIYGSIPELLALASSHIEGGIKLDNTKYYSTYEKMQKKQVANLKKQLKLKDEEIDLLKDELESIDRNYS